MNIKELMQKRSGLLDAVRGAKSSEELDGYRAELDDVNAQIALAEAKGAILDGLGAQGQPAPVAKGMSLGQHFVQHAKGHMPVGQKFAFTAPEYEVKTDPSPMTIPSSIQGALTDVQVGLIEGYRHPLVVADLFGQEQVSGNAITYFVENSSVLGGFAAVAEGAKKPMLSFGDPTEVTENLHKIAGYYKESDEMLSDAAWLASSIDGRGLYLHGLAEEVQLLSGSGTSNNVKGVLNRSGIQSKTYAQGAAIDADILLDAATAIENATGFVADAIVMNATDYNAIRKQKDGNGQYLAGGPFFAQYGNGTLQLRPSPWGIPTYTTPSISQGTALVGAFKMGGSVLRKGGVTVSLYNQNEDDAIYNRVTIVVESRIGLAVRYPAAFCKIAEAE